MHNHRCAGPALLVLVALLVTAGPGNAQPDPPDAPLAGGSMSAAGTGTAFLYRGALTRAGVGYTGTCAMTFRLWDTATAGAPVTAALALGGVTVQAGAFEAVLDFGAGAFTGPARWLETAVQCEGDVAPTTLTPRQALWPLPYAIHAGSAPWGGISGLPAGFADGVDNDTVYSAGAGLALNGDQLAVAGGYRLPQTCAAGELPKWDGTGWACGQDGGGTAYTAGTGLTLAGAEFSANTNVLQARITGACAVGQYVRAVAADGAVTCGTDADTDTTYTAGDGLSLAGNQFTADASLARVSAITPTVAAGGFITRTLADDTYQARVTGACAPGQKITAIAADGTVTCAADVDTNSGGTITGVTAGAGLAGGGTSGAVSLAVVTSTVQARITGSCAPGQKITAIAQDGTVTCDPDADTTYTAGDGLALTGTTFSADGTLARVSAITPTVAAGGFITRTLADDTYQARISAGSCAPGAVITAINADGSITCAPDADTTYVAANGLTLAGNVFSADSSLARTDAVVPMVTTAGFITRTWASATYQARVTGACAVGQYVRAVAADGSVTCGTDADTTYMAGDGLALTGTTFSADGTLARQANITGTIEAAGFITRTLADGTYQVRVTGSCAVGQYVRAVAADGTVTCGTDSGATYTAGAGLSLAGGAFSVVTSTIQARVTGACAVGQYLRAVAQDGTVTCGTDADTNTTYTAGTGLSLVGTQFSINTASTQARVTGSCTAGQKIIAIAADGSVTCAADDNTTYTAGAGLNLAGTQFSVNTTTTQARVSGTCAAGSSIRAIAADGTVTCEADDVGDNFPAGTVVFMLSGACPSGWTEATALRGRAVVGLPASGVQGGTYGTALGNQAARTVTLSTANLPAHTHDVDPAAVSPTTSSAGAHTHSVYVANGSGGSMNAAGQQWDALNPTYNIPTNSAGAHTHTVTVDVPNTTSTSAGSGTAADVTMPYIQLLACVKQ